jgi:flagellar assembly factor FliW
MKIKRDLPDSAWSGEKSVDMPYPKKVASLLSEDVVFHFQDGLPAFETAKKFVIVLNEKIRPFVYLKNLDFEDLGFVCVDPFLVCRDYSIKIPAKDLSLLELKESASALILSMVTVESDPKNTTANLLAPIIINMDNYLGRQVILDENNPVRYRIWDGLEEMEKNKNA